MTNYHVTSDNRRLRCEVTTGKCKYGTARHFSSAKEADAYVSLAADTLVTDKKPILGKANIRRAAERKLGYKGPKPAWWQTYQQQLAANEYGLDIKPEILDVIDSPAGKLAVVWQQDTIDRLDFYVDHGLVTKNIYLKNFETGQQHGYVRFEYANDESRKRSFGDDDFTPFRALEAFGSYAYKEKDLKEDLSKLSATDLHALQGRIWVAAHEDLELDITTTDGETVRSRNVNASHVPDDPHVLQRELKQLAKLAQKKADSTKSRLAIPLVSYAHLDNDFIGGGFGTTLYVYAARKLATENLTFRSSDTQTGYGKQMWVRLRKNFPAQVKPYRYRFMGQAKRAETLDFRG